MKLRLIVPFCLAAAQLSGCAEEPEVDTSYEESLPSPVAGGDTPAEPAPDNDTITGGADEQVDAVASGDAIPIEPAS